MKDRKTIIYLASFLFSIPVALMVYINSTFLAQFVDEKFVGLLYVLGSIFSIIALLISPKIFRNLGGYKFLLLVIGLDSLAILLFAFSKNAWSATLIFIIGMALNTLIVFSLDEILKIFSENSDTGKIRGVNLSVSHLGFIASQLALGTFLGHFSFKSIYLVAFCIMLLFFILSLIGLRNVPDPIYGRDKAVKYIEKFFQNKNLFRSYGLSLLTHFFYSWMVIYTPIYLSIHLGFSWQEIGIIFSVMLLPFLIIPFPLGKYADKIGERYLLMLGFTITAITTLSLFFINEHSVWIWAGLLFATRVGASIVEIMGDTYFFKHIGPENEEFVGVFRNASPVAYIISPIIAYLFFIFIPSFNFIYVVLGTIMLFGVYLASTIQKSDI